GIEASTTTAHNCSQRCSLTNCSCVTTTVMATTMDKYAGFSTSSNPETPSRSSLGSHVGETPFRGLGVTILGHRHPAAPYFRWGVAYNPLRWISAPRQSKEALQWQFRTKRQPN